jgi:arabinofuranosyltransferase
MASRLHALPGDVTTLERRPARPAVRAFVVVCLGGALAALGAQLLRVWPFTVDDTYITLRYSRHLAEGLGPTFNHDGARAEGYTSVLWMLVLALAHLLPVPALAVAKALGVAAVAATAWVVARWTRWATEPSPEAALGTMAAVAAYVTLGRTAVHAVSGMETAAYTLALTTLLYAGARTVASPAPPRYRRLSGIALVTGLCRPEGHLAAGVLLLLVGAQVPHGHRGAFARAVAWAWVAPLGLHEAWRLAYYGLPFPLPFYVKVTSPQGLPGAAPVLTWAGDVALRVGVPAALAVATASRALRPALAAGAALLLFLLLPEHLNGYDARYLAPLDPLVSVLFGIGVVRVLAWVPPGGLRVATAAALLSVAVVLALGASPASVANRLGYAEGLAAAHERLGRELARTGLRGRVALSDAGAIPYLSEWWTLDLVGLNHAGIALSGDRSPARVLAESPDVIVLVSGEEERFVTVDWNAWEGPLYEAARAAGFTRVAVRRFDVDYWLWVLARPDSAAGRALARSAAGPPVAEVAR